MGIKERKLREKEQRIREIISAARKIFMKKGYIHTTMLDIAEKSELSRRTLYLYFKSKDEISFTLMENAFSKLRDRISEAAGQAGTALERMDFMRQAYLDFYRHNYNDFYFTLYLDMKLNMKNLSDKDAAHCLKIVHDITNILMEVLIAGEQEGSLRSFDNLQKTAATAITIIHSTMQKMATRGEIMKGLTKFSQEEIINETFDLLFHSIRA